MSEQLKSLIKKRASVKQRVTLFSKFVNDIETTLGGATTDVDNKLLISELQIRLDNFSKLLIDFDDIQEQIECLHDDLDEQIEQRDLFERSDYQLLVKARKLVETHTIQNVSVEVSQTNSVQLSELAQNESCSKSVKLPQIQLSKW